MSKAIWECLKNNKKQFSWLKFVNFSLNDLIVHLESKFTPEMTWENYGTYWHIDHVKPLSWFDLKTEFNDAWTLSNLQPLEATKNLSKNNRYIG
jgi:5-methylcytosine-specific restriction endonuclease McrA